MYAVAHTVTTPTPRAAELLLATGFPGPVAPVSCGIDAAGYERPATRTAAPTVLFVGRLDAEKHVEELRRVAAACAAGRAAGGHR